MSKIYVTKKMISKQSLNELDFVFYDEFNYDYEKDEFIEIEHKRTYSDGTPINIDNMIDHLNKMKEMGATHVQIDTDVDHHGYKLLSSKFELSSKEDIDKYEEVINKELEKRNKIKELQAEINKISNL